MTDFLPDATNFDDLPVKDDPVKKFSDMKGYKRCSKCKGHGCWNIRTNCYNRRSNTPPHSVHFQSMCGACWGWGWIPGDQKCLHEWGESRTIGNCLHEWKCKNCGVTREVDSSD